MAIDIQGWLQQLLGGGQQQQPNMLATAPQQPVQPANQLAAAAKPQMAQQAPAPAPQPGFMERLSNFSNTDTGGRLNDMFTGWAMGSTPQESLGRGALMVSQGNQTRKGKDAQNQTVNYLKSKGMDEGQAKLMASNPTVLADYLKTQIGGVKPIEIAGKLVDPKDYHVIADFSTPASEWVKMTDGSILNSKTGETKTVDTGKTGEMFGGTGVEAQGLNYLVKNGRLSPDQAAQLAAGKTVSGPNGEIIFMTPNGVFNKPSDGSAAQPFGQADQNNGMITITEPKASDVQRNAMTYADRMQQSGQILDKFGMAGTGTFDNLASQVPIVGNQLVSPEFQKVDQAKRDFVNAQLRRESGAAISQSEFDNAERQYFPQKGDTPETVAQKAANRKLVVQGMIRDAGPSYKPAKSGNESGVVDYKDFFK